MATHLGIRKPSDDSAAWHADYLAEHAYQALLDEVRLAPKPGLVDQRGSGAHTDLSFALMCASARSLRPTFRALARAGQQIPLGLALREEIGAIGRRGEAVMLQRTGGVNTHRGAIWSLGLLITAAAQSAYQHAETIATLAGTLARLPDRHAPQHTGNKGELACRAYGVGGARAQAQAGFPHVLSFALPTLRQGRDAGQSEDSARLNALLAIMAHLDDTCLLARGGLPALNETQRLAQAILDAGGVATLAGRRQLKRLDQRLLALHVSPGGAADLLAATLFLDRLAAPPTLADHPITSPIKRRSPCGTSPL